jgi:hypothetical protein
VLVQPANSSVMTGKTRTLNKVREHEWFMMLASHVVLSGSRLRAVIGQILGLDLGYAPAEPDARTVPTEHEKPRPRGAMRSVPPLRLLRVSVERAQQGTGR